MNYKKTKPALIIFLMTTACTGQLPGSFRLEQQEQAFSTSAEVNTKIDILWVVDNSSSMDISQDKLKEGYAAFAKKYMQPTWDIRSAVITTDTYLANPAFTDYLNQLVPRTTPPWKSPYMNAKQRVITNPIFSTDSGMFESGVRFRDLVPSWGPDYSKLLPGIHDGPIAGLCFEGLPYFLNGVTQCAMRDDISENRGPEHCLNPSDGETSVTECVNTVENNTVHSGRAIISTLPTDESILTSNENREAWSKQLIDNFMINVTASSVGHGSERGLGSVLQLLHDNEPSETRLFRPNSLRVIVFLSDEDDQTIDLNTPASGTLTPFSFYKCDKATLESLNADQINLISGPSGFCCSDPANNCRFGREGTTCPSKNINGYQYTPSICAKDEALLPVVTIKKSLDEFFLALDTKDATEGTPNYIIVSIVPLTSEALISMQESRNNDDIAAGNSIRTIAVDRGERYIELGENVGNGSFAMDIAEYDYSPILDAIGKSIIEKKSTFTLARAPTSTEDMLIKIIHADGSAEIIPQEKFRVNGNTLIITDPAIVLNFLHNDKLIVNYQPKTVF
ncbi:MAG: hypothetical protein AABZ06_07850 [Bdellovibrionota bacterium]